MSGRERLNDRQITRGGETRKMNGLNLKKNLQVNEAFYLDEIRMFILDLFF